MEKCPYRDIVPENIPLKNGRQIAQWFDVTQCPYARALNICNICSHENYLDEDKMYRIKNNIRYTHIQCSVCGKYFDITKEVQIVCLADSTQCLLAQEKED